MTENPQQHPIRDWQAGETVSGFALLAKKERRQDRNANDYLDLELVDSTGRIAGKIWGDSPALAGDFEANDFVAFKGLVKSFRDRLQLSIQKCRKATEADRGFGFDEAALIPSTAEDIDDLWTRLERIYRDEIDSPVYKSLAAAALDRHGAALREHPAAKTIHHAYRGGLLEHTTSMAELALMVGAHYPELDSDLLLLGVLFHDLGKLLELGSMPASGYTPVGRLVGHIVIGRDLLRELLAEAPDLDEESQLHLEHLVLSHQGQRDFGAPVEPMTAEAIVLHALDNLDSKLAQIREAAKNGAGFQFLRGLGRYMYLGAGQEPTGDDERRAEPEEQTQLKL